MNARTLIALFALVQCGCERNEEDQPHPEQGAVSHEASLADIEQGILDGEIFPSIGVLNKFPQYDFDLTNAYGPDAYRLLNLKKVSAIAFGEFLGGAENRHRMGYEKAGDPLEIDFSEIQVVLNPDHVGVWDATASVPKFALKFEGDDDSEPMYLVACLFVEQAESERTDIVHEWVVFEPLSYSRGPVDRAASAVLSEIWSRLANRGP